jgi:hypothetical protein
MAGQWTRRKLLGHTGAVAAGAAGLGLAACSSGAASTGPTASVGYARGAARRRGDGLQHFVSRPDLTPPVTTLTRHGLAPDGRYTFLNSPYSGSGHGGSVIRDSRGDLVWLGRNAALRHRMDVNTQTYRGKPVLTWWEGLINTEGYGKGDVVIADSSYRVTHTLKAAQGLMADHHEFVLTPQGTALITAYRQSAGDLSSVGGPQRGYLLSGVVQEIDVATGDLLFHWDSRDHVALTESYQRFTGGTKDNPYNYFHVNSIAVLPDGDLLISGRNTWALYKVSRRTGQVAWRLGGRKSDFALGAGVRFYWQHHARPHGAGAITLFDNGSSPAEERSSRALIVSLDTTAMRATLQHAYSHPGRRLLAGAMGSVQLLPDGRVYVGWGSDPFYSEFAPDGQLLMDAQISNGHPSYRAFSDAWTGHPAERPAAAARTAAGGATVYASWNGATEVTSWTVLAGPHRGALRPAGSVRRTGFETAVAVHHGGPWYAAEARNSSGHVLARSAAVRVRSA